MKVFEITTLNEEFDVKKGVLGPDGKPMWTVIDKETGNVVKRYQGGGAEEDAVRDMDNRNAKLRARRIDPSQQNQTTPQKSTPDTTQKSTPDNTQTKKPKEPKYDKWGYKKWSVASKSLAWAPRFFAMWAILDTGGKTLTALNNLVTVYEQNGCKENDAFENAKSTIGRAVVDTLLASAGSAALGKVAVRFGMFLQSFIPKLHPVAWILSAIVGAGSALAGYVLLEELLKKQSFTNYIGGIVGKALTQVAMTVGRSACGIATEDIQETFVYEEKLPSKSEISAAISAAAAKLKKSPKGKQALGAVAQEYKKAKAGAS